MTTRGSIILDPRGATATVDITGGTVYDAPDGAPVSLPLAVAAVMTVWVDPGTYLVTWSLGDVEVDTATADVGPGLSLEQRVTLRDLSPAEVQALVDGGGSGTSVPVPTTGDAGKVVTVNGAEDGYELDTPSGGTQIRGADVVDGAFTASGASAVAAAGTGDGSTATGGVLNLSAGAAGDTFGQGALGASLQLTPGTFTEDGSQSFGGAVNMNAGYADLSTSNVGGFVTIAAGGATGAGGSGGVVAIYGGSGSDGAASGSAYIQSPGGVAPLLEADDTGLGFFGAEPVARPAAPVTLDDVIAALKALGLVAT